MKQSFYMNNLKTEITSLPMILYKLLMNTKVYMCLCTDYKKKKKTGTLAHRSEIWGSKLINISSLH